MAISICIAEPDPGSVSYVAIPPPLNAVWLACHCFKRLAKKDIVDTNIQEAVENIVAYTTGCRISLRIAGGLLVGVTRLYGRKMEIFQADCFEILRRMTLTRDSERDSRARLRSGEIVRGGRRGRRIINELDVMNLPSINEDDSLLRTLESERDYLEEFEEQQRNDTLLFEEVTKHLRLAATADPSEFDEESLVSGSEHSANIARSRKPRRKKPRIQQCQEYAGDMLGQDNHVNRILLTPPSQLEVEDLNDDERQGGTGSSDESSHQQSGGYEPRTHEPLSTVLCTNSGTARAQDSKQFSHNMIDRSQAEQYPNSSQSHTNEFDSQMFSTNSVPDAEGYAELGIFVLPYNSQEVIDNLGGVREVGLSSAEGQQLPKPCTKHILGSTGEESITSTPQNISAENQDRLQPSPTYSREPSGITIASDSSSAVPGPIERLRGETNITRDEPGVEAFEDNSLLLGMFTSRRRRLSDSTLPPQDDTDYSMLIPEAHRESLGSISIPGGGDTHSVYGRRDSLAESVLNMTMYSTGSPGSDGTVAAGDRFHYSPTEVLSTSDVISDARTIPRVKMYPKLVHTRNDPECENLSGASDRHEGVVPSRPNSRDLALGAGSSRSSECDDGAELGSGVDIRSNEYQTLPEVNGRPNMPGIDGDPEEIASVRNTEIRNTDTLDSISRGCDIDATTTEVERSEGTVTIVTRMRRRQQQQMQHQEQLHERHDGHQRHHTRVARAGRPVSVAAWLKHCGVALDSATILDDRVVQQWQSKRKQVTIYRRSHATAVPSFCYRINVGSVAQDYPEDGFSNDNVVMPNCQHWDSRILAEPKSSQDSSVLFHCGISGCLEQLLGGTQRILASQSHERRRNLLERARNIADQAALRRSDESPPKGSPAARRRLSSGVVIGRPLDADSTETWSKEQQSSDVAEQISADVGASTSGSLDIRHARINPPTSRTPIHIDVEDGDEIIVELYDDTAAVNAQSSPGAASEYCAPEFGLPSVYPLPMLSGEAAAERESENGTPRLQASWPVREDEESLVGNTEVLVASRNGNPAASEEARSERLSTGPSPEGCCSDSDVYDSRFVSQPMEAVRNSGNDAGLDLSEDNRPASQCEKAGGFNASGGMPLSPHCLGDKDPFPSAVIRSMALAGLRLQSDPVNIASESGTEEDSSRNSNSLPCVILETQITPAVFSPSIREDLQSVIRGQFGTSNEKSVTNNMYENTENVSQHLKYQQRRQYLDRTPFKTPLASYSENHARSANLLESTPLETSGCTPTPIPLRNIDERSSVTLEQRIETPAVQQQSWKPPDSFLTAGIAEGFRNTFESRFEGAVSWQGGIEIELKLPASASRETVVSKGDGFGSQVTKGYVPPSFSAASQESWSSVQQEVGFSRRTLRTLEYLSTKLTQSMLFVTSSRLLVSSQSTQSLNDKENGDLNKGGDAEVVAEVDRRELICTPTVSLKQLVTAHQSRDVVAAVFFELLSLRSRMIINLQAVSPTTSTEAFVLSAEPVVLRQQFEQLAATASGPQSPKLAASASSPLTVLSQPVSLRPDSNDILISTAHRYQQLIDPTTPV